MRFFVHRLLKISKAGSWAGNSRAKQTQKPLNCLPRHESPRLRTNMIVFRAESKHWESCDKILAISQGSDSRAESCFRCKSYWARTTNSSCSWKRAPRNVAPALKLCGEL